jgi:hypothetical protein
MDVKWLCTKHHGEAHRKLPPSILVGFKNG